MNKIPKCKTKNILPQQYLKFSKHAHYEENIPNVHQNNIKFSDTLHQFGRDITNNINNVVPVGIITSFSKKSSSVNNKVCNLNKKENTQPVILNNIIRQRKLNSYERSNVEQNNKVLYSNNNINKNENNVIDEHNQDLISILSKKKLTSFGFHQTNTNNFNNIYNVNHDNNFLLQQKYSIGNKLRNSITYGSKQKSQQQTSAATNKMSETKNKISQGNRDLINRVKGQSTMLKTTILCHNIESVSKKVESAENPIQNYNINNNSNNNLININDADNNIKIDVKNFELDEPIIQSKIYKVEEDKKDIKEESKKNRDNNFMKDVHIYSKQEIISQEQSIEKDKEKEKEKKSLKQNSLSCSQLNKNKNKENSVKEDSIIKEKKEKEKEIEKRNKDDSDDKLMSAKLNEKSIEANTINSKKEKAISVKKSRKRERKSHHYKIIEKDENNKYFNISKIKNNPQVPKEYINTIYNNLLIEEIAGPIPKAEYNYMTKQKEINEQMRSILVDWIIDVHCKFGFTDETLYMTVGIIDRFLSHNEVTRVRLQLLGITALMIACKHEEIDLPKVDDFIYITDNAYTKEEVFKMESDVLLCLKFNLLYPSPIKFFEYLSLNFGFNKTKHMMGKYLMESFLIDLKSIKYQPSVISCACAYIVMKFFKMSNYQQSYDKKYYILDNSKTKLSEHDIKDCAKDICLFVDNVHKTNYLACQKKYSKNEYERVAIIITGH